MPLKDKKIDPQKTALLLSSRPLREDTIHINYYSMMIKSKVQMAMPKTKPSKNWPVISNQSKI
jgi:hypothetical protein